MDVQAATAYLATSGKKPSEEGAAVDVLYRAYGSYGAVSDKVTSEPKRPASYWSIRHRVFLLPVGIRWKVDEKHLNLAQANEITRLEGEDEQWKLAISAIEKGLSAAECKNVVNQVLKREVSIDEALSVVAGVRFEDLSPPILLLPVGVDFWFALTREAWSRGESWEDLCFRFIRRGLEVDLEKVADQMEAWAVAFRDEARCREIKEERE